MIPVTLQRSRRGVVNDSNGHVDENLETDTNQCVC